MVNRGVARPYLMVGHTNFYNALPTTHLNGGHTCVY